MTPRDDNLRKMGKELDSIAYELGTVCSLIQRKHDLTADERQQCARLDQWRARQVVRRNGRLGVQTVPPATLSD